MEKFAEILCKVVHMHEAELRFTRAEASKWTFQVQIPNTCASGLRKLDHRAANIRLWAADE